MSRISNTFLGCWERILFAASIVVLALFASWAWHHLSDNLPDSLKMAAMPPVPQLYAWNMPPEAYFEPEIPAGLETNPFQVSLKVKPAPPPPPPLPIATED